MKKSNIYILGIILLVVGFLYSENSSNNSPNYINGIDIQSPPGNSISETDPYFPIGTAYTAQAEGEGSIKYEPPGNGNQPDSNIAQEVVITKTDEEGDKKLNIASTNSRTVTLVEVAKVSGGGASDPIESNGTDTIAVPLGTTITFQATSNPQSESGQNLFTNLDNKPNWTVEGGTIQAGTGTGHDNCTVTFNELSTSSTDLKKVKVSVAATSSPSDTPEDQKEIKVLVYKITPDMPDAVCKGDTKTLSISIEPELGNNAIIQWFKESVSIGSGLNVSVPFLNLGKEEIKIVIADPSSGTNFEHTQDIWTVTVGKIQYRVDDDDEFMDISADSPLYQNDALTVTFKAVRDPENSPSWPEDDGARWGGTLGAAGTLYENETITIDLPDATNENQGIKTIEINCETALIRRNVVPCQIKPNKDIFYFGGGMANSSLESMTVSMVPNNLQGEFAWRVLNPIDITPRPAVISNNGNEVTELTNNQNSINIISKNKGSDTQGGQLIELDWNNLYFELEFDVRYCALIDRVYINSLNLGTVPNFAGYNDFFELFAYDQFGDEIQNTGFKLNEKFSDRRESQTYPNNNWPTPPADGTWENTGTIGGFGGHELYSVGTEDGKFDEDDEDDADPAPVWYGHADQAKRVFYLFQEYFSGSDQSGQGVRASIDKDGRVMDRLRYCRGTCRTTETSLATYHGP